MKRILMYLIVLLISTSCLFSQVLKEKFFSDIAAKELKGITEFVLKSGKRVDILTETQAIEVEFAFKWFESIGQALFYAIETNKKPCIICIVKTAKDYREFNHLLMVCQVHKIDLYMMEYYSRRLKAILIY